MICYMDILWCSCERCKHHEDCDLSEKYAMRKQAKEVPDVSDRIPYAVRDMSGECEDYEVESWKN